MTSEHEDFLKFIEISNYRLEKRALLLAEAEQNVEDRVKKEAAILAEKMIHQARKERDNARQKAKRLKTKLAFYEQT